MKYSSITTHTGDLRCHTLFSPSQSSFDTDVAAADGGMGQYPCPAEMLAATVASCMLSMMAYTGKHHDFDTQGISIAASVVKSGGSIGGLNLHITVPMAVSEGAKQHLITAVQKCPVGKAVAVEKNITWQWGEDCGGCCAR